MRASFACMMFWFVSMMSHDKEKVILKDIFLLYVCAICGVGINQFLFVKGMKISSPIDASIIATGVPIFVLLLAAIILHEPISTRKTGGVALGVCGGLLLVFSSIHSSGGSGSLRGNMLIMLNQLMFSLYLVMSRPLSQKYSSVTMMKWMFLFSTATLFPFCAGSMDVVPLFRPASFDMSQCLALIYLLFGATFLAFMLIPMSLRYIRPTTVSMYNYVQPIVASIIAISVGQDTFSIQKLVSLLLVGTGVYLVTTSKGSQQTSTVKN